MEKISLKPCEDLALRQRKEVDQIEQIADKEKEKEEFVKEVKEFHCKMSRVGGYIADEEERDFLRAILRYWVLLCTTHQGCILRLNLMT